MTEIRSQFKKIVAQLLSGLMIVSQLVLLLPAQVAHAAGSTSLVISQVQTAGAAAADEFIELYNPTSSSVSLTGWSIQYRSGASATFNKQNFTAGKSVAAHGYFLIANSSGTFAASADQTYSNATIAMSAAATGGTVFLVNDQTTLSTGLESTIVDKVGFGTGGTVFAEGSAIATAPSASNSIVRLPNTSAGNGTDTDNNSVDFTSLTPSNARNTSSTPTPEITPTPSVTVTPSAVTASIVYTATGSSTPASHFGVTTVNAEVTASNNSLTSPFITFNRPGSDLVIIPLVFNASSNTWKTQYGFVVWPANSPQDGTVQVSLSASNATFTITSGSSFTVDTKVNKPVVMVNSRCSTAQDSFTADVDSDVNKVYIYRHSNLDPMYLVAVANASGGHVDEVFIGDNTYGTLYLVAQDTTGNRSATTTLTNDITAPSAPTLQLEAGNSVITATWPQVSDASTYILRWRKVGDATWSQKTVTTYKHDIYVTNGVEYEVSVASVDGSCNQSSFVTASATGLTDAELARLARGGVADHEAQVLAALYEDVDVASTKDGEVDGKIKSPYSIEEDKNQDGIKDSEDLDNNGIKDSEEDKNGNGIPDGQEDQSSKPEEQAQDRSRLIVGIAIALIIAGTAIAAYSWYKGEGTDAAPAAKRETPKPAAEEKPAPAPAPERKKKGGAKGGRGKRKTKW